MKYCISLIICIVAASVNIMYGQIDSENDRTRIPETYKEILAIQIKDIEKNHSVTSSDGSAVSLLSFGGTCDNDYFSGSVVPGGIDCQRNDGKISSLSARYMLEGTDFAGDSCRIFIENKAVANSNISKPQIITDSRALSFLNDSDLIGVLDNSGPFTVRIYVEQSGVDNSKIKIPGSLGLLAATIEKPDLASGQRCPMVIICHGFGGSRIGGFLEDLAHNLRDRGIASIRFDFNGHGESEGRFQDMTVPNEIEDAKHIYQYVSALPFVDTREIGIVGHSQGGVVSSMLAGELGHKHIKAIVLMCAAAVLRDDCIRGNTFGKTYNPLDPPETVDIGGGNFLGREYIKTAFSLPIYETAERYHGSACIIHGTGDRIVPYTYSLRFHDIWPGSEYHQLPGYDHGFSPNPQTSVDIATDYLFRTLSK